MLALLTFVATALAAPVASPVKWRFSVAPVGDGLVRVELRTAVEEGWHIYATMLPSDQGPIATGIRFHASEAFSLAGALEEPQPVEAYDPNFGVMVRYHKGSPAFAQLIRPSRPGAFVVEGEVEYMACNDKTCLPPVVVPFKLKVESM